MPPQRPHEEEREAERIREQEQQNLPEKRMLDVVQRALEAEVDEEVPLIPYGCAHVARGREDGQQRVDQEAPELLSDLPSPPPSVSLALTRTEARTTPSRARARCTC
eukprot:757348-Hanusia_phi.AAC.5